MRIKEIPGHYNERCDGCDESLDGYRVAEIEVSRHISFKLCNACLDILRYLLTHFDGRGEIVRSQW